MDIDQIVKALKHLEGNQGSTPSVEDIAEQAGCSPATALKYLQRAVAQKLVVKRNGKYLSPEVASAFSAQKK